MKPLRWLAFLSVISGCGSIAGSVGSLPPGCFLIVGVLGVGMVVCPNEPAPTPTPDGPYWSGNFDYHGLGQ